MIYLSHAPGPPLAEFIEYFWHLNDAPAHARERILPSGTLELVVNLHEDEFRIYDPADPGRCRRFSGTLVSGAYRGYFVVDTREHASIVGVHFKAGGALPFLGLPLGELADRHVDLASLWGPTAVELRDRLCSAPEPKSRFRILEEALARRLSSAVPLHGAVRAALDRLTCGGTGVRQVASDLELSHRRFIELFSREVGMTPKRFARVLRFQSAMALARSGPRPDWAPLALDFGYFDQAHMIRDCVDFSGLPPGTLLRHGSVPVKESHVAMVGT